MASVYDLKPRFQALLRPSCRLLARAGVTANAVTVGAVVLSAAAGLWIALAPLSAAPYLALPVVLFLRMALNAIDGMLAREFDMQSPLGGLFNELGDVVSDTVLYLPFGFHPAVPWWAVIGVVIAAIWIEMVGVIAVQIGASRRYDGPFGKSDRAFAFGLLGLLFGVGLASESWVTWYLAIALALSAATIVTRARRALREVSGAR
jgi:CDP-diacylglycerol--glycerol-3-phosphate 3-phosphatidyltransferase